MEDDNAGAWAVFSACLTQWRVGANGPYGLDYQAVELLRTAYAVPGGPAFWGAVQHLEALWLTEWKQRRERGAKHPD